MPRSPCLADKAPDMKAIRFQNSVRGTRNLAIGISESSSCNPESTAWNLQSRDGLSTLRATISCTVLGKRGDLRDLGTTTEQSNMAAVEPMDELKECLRASRELKQRRF